MMDKMTSDMCNRGTRRLGYARVLVEIKANKGFRDNDEINYVDKQNKKKSTIWVKVEYSWRPKVCSHCKVFGHNHYKCTVRPRTEEKEKINTAANKEGGTVIRLEKVWNIGKSNVEELKRSANKYVVLSEVNKENSSKTSDEIMIDRRLIVDEFVTKKLQASISDTKDWSYDMINYFKMNVESDEEDVMENVDDVVQSIIADEVDGNGSDIGIMVIQISKQSMCLVEAIPDKIKFYNYLNHPLVITGDFNVTLKPEEHSNGGFGYNADMQEFSDLVNQLKVDDLCSFGFHFTWTKSLKNPNISTLKKLDRILVNESFINQYCRAHRIFLPYLVSDHSVGLMIFPDGLPKKVKSFRFTNYIADKKEFLETVHGNLFEKAKCLKASLKMAQNEVDKDPFNVEKRRKAICILEEYIEVSNDELKLLHQKAKIKWLREGDKNSGYFHNILKSRKHTNRVESICDENGVRYWGDDVAKQIVKHFQEFMGVPKPAVPFVQLGDIVQLKLSKEDVEAMIVEVSDKEIKEAMGGRGLRQGDTMSPYLFTLVMEVLNMIMIKNIKEDRKFKYHCGCKDLKLTHLCFVDDLLMLCNGGADSLKLIKKSLDEFNSVSGDSAKGKARVAWSLICRPKDRGGLGIKPLQKWDLYDARLADDAKVADLIHNDRWNWPDEWMEDFPDLQQIPLPVLDNDVNDKIAMITCSSNVAMQQKFGTE
ncbi:RNA-directed DNA polymerase, eukaryota, reverse transcriptase zinc-binding domain protein [Tanacetum coccineum]